MVVYIQYLLFHFFFPFVQAVLNPSWSSKYVDSELQASVKFSQLLWGQGRELFFAFAMVDGPFSLCLIFMRSMRNIAMTQQKEKSTYLTPRRNEWSGSKSSFGCVEDSSMSVARICFRLFKTAISPFVWLIIRFKVLYEFVLNRSINVFAFQSFWNEFLHDLSNTNWIWHRPADVRANK